MPLTRAQAEDFVQAFFRDHRLVAPPVCIRKRFTVTLRRRKRLNLPRVVTREALADQVAAVLCRQVICRDKAFHWEAEVANHRLDYKRLKKRPKWFKVSWKDFREWRTYTRGVVVHHFGKGDGLK
jgi:hypothetical protein